MKRCKTCRETLKKERFQFSAVSKDKLQTSCINCNEMLEKNRKHNWQYIDDNIVLNGNYTYIEKMQKLGMSKMQIILRRQALKRCNIKSITELNLEREILMDCIPDISFSDLSEYLQAPKNYVSNRVNELRRENLLRKNAVMGFELGEEMGREEKTYKYPKQLKIFLQTKDAIKNANVRNEEFPLGAISAKEIKNMIFSDGFYNVRVPASNGHKAVFTDFAGELIYQNKYFITLKNKRGIIESFLKVDFYTNDVANTSIERIDN